MKELTQKTNYEELVQLILNQYKDSNNLTGIIESVLRRANISEQALFEIRDEFYLFNAVGAQLDVIGVIFNISRFGRFDSLYRKAIQEKAVLQYSGEPESIIELMQSVYGATQVQYRPAYPGKYYLFTDASGVLSREINIINPAGVLALFEKPILDAAGGFIVDALGRKICSTIEIQKIFIVDALGNLLVDASNKSVVTLKII